MLSFRLLLLTLLFLKERSSNSRIIKIKNCLLEVSTNNKGGGGVDELVAAFTKLVAAFTKSLFKTISSSNSLTNL